MIQESVNQLLTTFGLASRLSPNYEHRQTAKNIYSKGIAAEKGLEDISKSIQRVESGDKPAYSAAELRDIESRVGEHVSNIAALKTAAIPGQSTAKYIPKDPEGRVAGLSHRADYSERLMNIENSIKNMKERAMQSMTDKATSSLEQDENFKTLRRSLMRLDDPYKLKKPFGLEDKNDEK